MAGDQQSQYRLHHVARLADHGLHLGHFLRQEDPVHLPSGLSLVIRSLCFSDWISLLTIISTLQSAGAWWRSVKLPGDFVTIIRFDGTVIICTLHLCYLNRDYQTEHFLIQISLKIKAQDYQNVSFWKQYLGKGNVGGLEEEFQITSGFCWVLCNLILRRIFFRESSWTPFTSCTSWRLLLRGNVLRTPSLSMYPGIQSLSTGASDASTNSREQRTSSLVMMKV